MNHHFITTNCQRETEIRTNSKLSRTDTNTCTVVVGMSLHPPVPSTAIQNYTAVEMFQHTVNFVPRPVFNKVSSKQHEEDGGREHSQNIHPLQSSQIHTW